MMRFALITLILLLLGTSLALPSVGLSRSGVWYRGQVAVLMYHHVHDEAKSSSTVTTKLFSDQLSYLRDKGYQFITLEEFRRFLAGSRVPDNAVLVTFDDGYESFYQYAYPVLRQLRIPAVNFVITHTLDDPGADAIPYLSREQIREMTQQSKGIDVQCHTHALHAKTESGQALLTTPLATDGGKESPAEYERRIASDMSACLYNLQELSPRAVDALAYPFGIFNDAAKNIVRRSGIKYAFTITPGMTTPDTDPLQIPRINAGSPWISPEALHRSIIRQVVAFGRHTEQVRPSDAPDR